MLVLFSAFDRGKRRFQRVEPLPFVGCPLHWNVEPLPLVTVFIGESVKRWDSLPAIDLATFSRYGDEAHRDQCA